MEAMVNWFKSGWDWLCQKLCEVTANAVGTTMVGAGIITKELAIIIIMLGVLLWMCRYTKVFRWGMIGYMIGFILEMLGSIIRI